MYFYCDLVASDKNDEESEKNQHPFTPYIIS